MSSGAQPRPRGDQPRPRPPAVGRRRRNEFRRFARFSSREARESIPDPNARKTFESSRLDWSKLERPEHAERHKLVKDLLALRARVVAPRLPAVPLAGYANVRVAMGGVYRVKRILADYAPDVVHLASPFVLGWRAAQAAHQLGSVPTRVS